MRTRRVILVLAFWWVMSFTGSLARAQLLGRPASAEQIVNDATNVITQSAGSPTGIPQQLIRDAQAIAIVPNMVRGAFIVGMQHGRGVLMLRAPNGAWQAPRMIQMTGGSVGYQIGVQSTDLILVFRTPQSVTNLLNGTLRIGVDASAAAGPVGRQASAATDLPLQAEILSYSRARGAFLGVSIDGSAISLDPASDAMFYQPPGTVPASAQRLIQTLSRYASGNPTTVAPPGPTTETVAPATAPAPRTIEEARQQLDVVSRQLASDLDAEWKQFLALPPEVYVANGVPSAESIRQAIARYEEVSRQQKFAPLTSRAEFQGTLKALWRLGELQQGATQPLQLPPPPIK